MEDRAETPPVLDWLVVSLPCSPDGEEDLTPPFETLKAAVTQLETQLEFSASNEDNFVLRRKSIDYWDDSKGPSRKNSLKSVCDDVIKFMSEIERECGKEDCYHVFYHMQSLDQQLRQL